MNLGAKLIYLPWDQWKFENGYCDISELEARRERLVIERGDLFYKLRYTGDDEDAALNIINQLDEIDERIADIDRELKARKGSEEA